MRSKRFYQLSWVGLLVGVLGLLLAATVGASTSLRDDVQRADLLITEDPYYVLGEPCGGGELLPDWTLCLHGGIALRDASGQPVWLNNVPLTITRGISSVTGMTFIHPGYTTPTYGIDISSLWPEFLGTVTLTANISGTLVERQIIFYPDFRTQNQRFDLVLQDVNALDPAPLWGYVADLAARGPVTGATVTAEHAGARVTVTTSTGLSETLPFYAFTTADLTMLGVTPGQTLTLTAGYQNDTDQRVIVLEAAPQQVNFVTGWKCDGFDPLPRSSGGEGMPRSSGGEGMPNLGCFWGYAKVDGQIQTEVTIHLEISGTVYSAITQIYPGETQPRYGIGIWGGSIINGTSIRATGIYSDVTSADTIIVKLDNRLTQRIDLNIAIASISHAAEVRAIAPDPAGHIWLGNRSNLSVLHDNELIDILDVGIYHNTIHVDHTNNVWAASSCCVYVIDHKGTLANTSDDQIVSIPHPGGIIRFLLMDPNDNIWIGGDTIGLAVLNFNETPFDISDDEWQSFTYPELPSNWAWSAVFDNENRLWIGTVKGIGILDYNNTPLDKSDDYWYYMKVGNIRSIYIDSSNYVWFGEEVTRQTYVLDFNGTLSDTTDDRIKNIDYGLNRFITNDRYGRIIFGSENRIAISNCGGNIFYDNCISYISVFPTPWVIATDTDFIWIGGDHGFVILPISITKSNLHLQGEVKNSVLPGESVPHLITLTNRGPLIGLNIVLTYTVPANTILDSVTPTPTHLFNNSLVWEFPVLHPNQTITTVANIVIPITISTDIDLISDAIVTSVTLDGFSNDNIAHFKTHISIPDQADVRLTAYGPPVLVAGTVATYTLCADKAGGLTAQNVTVTASLSPEMVPLHGIPAPLTLTPPTWALGDLAWNNTPVCLTLAAGIAPTITAGTWLTLTAHVTTTTLPDPAPENNTATIILPTTLDDSLTLILTAPERMLQRYGATPLQTTLYALAQHPQVRGVVIDVLQDPAVRAAYTAWDNAPLSVTRAQAVASSIKALIDTHTITYSHLRYLVIVGSDDIIPFYRVLDRNPTMWQESAYAAYVPGATPTWAAFHGNYLLTDDFYAARSATVPPSTFWTPGVPFFIPDFALGRLVETPDEIQAALTTFLEHDGIMPLGPIVVGAEHNLVNDSAQVVCQTLAQDGLSGICTNHPGTFKTHTLALESGSIWAAWHSNHFSLGILRATEIQNRAADFGHLKVTSIGCHSGLNVQPGVGGSSALDLPQAISGRGSIYIAPTAYAYASRLGIGYSEVLFLELSHMLALTTTQEIGPALVRAKQAYYTAHPWFDHLDEKVLLGMTLYGLPMARVTSPEDPLLNTLAGNNKPMGKVTPLGNSAVLTYTLSGLTYTTYTTTYGTYLEYQGQTIAQDGLPVQPALTQLVPAIVQERTPRGVWLSSAEYSSIANFEPVIAQGWAIGALRAPQLSGASVTRSGWDRPRPYALGQFVGLHDAQAALNLVLGAYNADTQVEQLFTALTLAVRYSNSTDVLPPVIVQSTGEGAILHATITDESGVAAVSAVCDNGQGQWQEVPLSSLDGSSWQGHVTGLCLRFYLQVADTGGNITVSEWQANSLQHLYLPLVLRAQP